MPSKDVGADAGGGPLDLPPDPVIEAYKKDVDRTLLVENLKLSVEERIEQLARMARLVDEARKPKGG